MSAYDATYRLDRTRDLAARLEAGQQDPEATLVAEEGRLRARRGERHVLAPIREERRCFHRCSFLVGLDRMPMPAWMPPSDPGHDEDRPAATEARRWATPAGNHDPIVRSTEVLAQRPGRMTVKGAGLSETSVDGASRVAMSPGASGHTDESSERRDEMAASDILREELLALIDGSDARMPFDAAVADFPEEAINTFPPHVPYTPWQLLEHLRITQWDILDYIRNRAYLAPDWPEEYWPAHDATATPEQFAATIDGFRSDSGALHDLVADPASDLLAVIPNTPGHTILREVRVVGDHNAYHIGEFTILRQVMGTWPPGREE